MSLRAEVQLVRETLESALPPSMATSVLFDALDRWGRGVPATSDDLVELVRGPLADILAGRVGDEARDAIVSAIVGAIEERLAAAGAGELELEIDLEEGDDSRTSQMEAVPHPVSVVVVSATDELAQRLVAALGDARVYPRTVTGEEDFRHATFSVAPLLAMVDCARPPFDAPKLALALRGLPDRTLAVVWGDETSYGREVRARLESANRPALFLDRAEGIGPLLDLVLSRFERASSIPPP